MVRHLVTILSATMICFVSGCLPKAAVSDVKSGFVGADCKSLIEDYKFQEPKLTELAASYKGKFASFTKAKDETVLDKDAPSLGGDFGPALELAEGDAPQKLDVMAFEDEFRDELGNDKFARSLAECGTKLRAVNDDEIYQTCLDFFTILDKVKTTAKAYDDKRCADGFQKNIVPVLAAYCDVACRFGDLDCTKCSISFKNPLGLEQTSSAVCQSEFGGRDAGQAVCNKLEAAGMSECKVASCETGPGKNFAGEESGGRVAGQKLEIGNVSLSTFLTGAAMVKVTAGVAAEANASLTVTLGGNIMLMSLNPAEDILTPNGNCRADTQYFCEVQVKAETNAMASAGAGVGGAFTVFGNGIEARATGTVGGNVVFWKMYSTKTPPLTCAGIDKTAMAAHCFDYVAAWVKNDVPREVDKDFRVVAAALAKANGASEGEARSSTAYQGGVNAGPGIYRQLKTLLYYGACHKYPDGNLGMSGDAQVECDRQSQAWGTNAADFQRGCYEKVAAVCKTGL